MRILAISGSLRGGSSNTQALRALTSLVPDGVSVELYEGIGDLPHFNPDLDGETPIPAVEHFRAALAGADGVVFSSPEYAHGVPGVLKNAGYVTRTSFSPLTSSEVMGPNSAAVHSVSAGVVAAPARETR